MKPATPLRGLLSHLPSVFATLSLSVASIGMLGQASAEAVDSALVLPVDVSTHAFPQKPDSLMDREPSHFASGTSVVSKPESFASLMAGLGFTLLFRRRS